MWVCQPAVGYSSPMQYQTGQHSIVAGQLACQDMSAKIHTVDMLQQGGAILEWLFGINCIFCDQAPKSSLKHTEYRLQLTLRSLHAWQTMPMKFSIKRQVLLATSCNKARVVHTLSVTC